MTKHALLVCLLLTITGCSSETDQTAQQNRSKDHVWKSKTRVLDNAKAVENTVLDAAKERQDRMKRLNE